MARVITHASDRPDEVLSKFPSPSGFSVPIATVAKEERWRTTYWIATRFEDGTRRRARPRLQPRRGDRDDHADGGGARSDHERRSRRRIKSSSRGRSAAQVETALVNAADRVNRAGMGCDYTIYVQAAVMVPGLGPPT